MLRGACLLPAVLAVAIGVGQSRPDFSGTWTPVESPSSAPAPPNGFGWPSSSATATNPLDHHHAVRD